MATDENDHANDLYLEEMQRRREAGLCFDCAEPDGRSVSFMRVMSFLIFTSHRNWDTFLCPSCAAKTGIREQAISGLLGWWGFPWGLMTFGALFINTRSLLKSTLAGKAAALMIPAGGILALSALFSSLDVESPDLVDGDRLSREGVELYDRGVRFFDAGDYGRAAVAFEGARKHDPRSWLVRYSLAESLYGLGDVERALAELNFVVRDHSVFEPAHRLRAICLDDMGRYQESMTEWRRVLSMADDVEAHIGYQDAAAQCERAEQVAASYRKAFESTDEPDVATRYLFARLLTDPNEKLPHLEATVPEIGVDRAVIDLIATYMALRRPEGARKLIDDREAPLLSPRGELVSAEIELHDGRAQAALDRIREAQAGGLTTFGFLVQAHRAHRMLGDLPAANAAMDEFDELAGEPSVTTVYFRVCAENEFGEEEAARSMLAKYTELVGDATTASLGFAADIERWTGNPARAAELLATPPSDASKSGQAWLRVRKALCHIEAGQFEAARGACRAALTLESDHDAFQARIASMLLGKLEIEEFRAMARREGAEFDNDAHYFVGLCHRLHGRDEEAAAEFKACLASVDKGYPARLARRMLE